MNSRPRVDAAKRLVDTNKHIARRKPTDKQQKESQFVRGAGVWLVVLAGVSAAE